MDIHLTENVLQQLEIIAQQQGRDLNFVIQEAVEQYLARQAEARFRAEVRAAIKEHQWLLDELAKR